MLSVLLQILPFALASAVSPVLLTGSVLVISSKQRPVQKAVYFAIGATLAIVPIALAILLLDKGAASVSAGPTNGRDILRLVIGALLVVFAVRTAIKKPKSKHAKDSQSGSPLKYLLAGFVLMFANTSTIIMYLPAAAILNHSSLGLVGKLVGMAEMVVFSLLPVVLPPLLVASLGSRSDVILKPLSAFVTHYGHYVIAILFGLIGLLLFLQGIKPLVHI